MDLYVCALETRSGHNQANRSNGVMTHALQTNFSANMHRITNKRRPIIASTNDPLTRHPVGAHPPRQQEKKGAVIPTSRYNPKGRASIFTSNGAPRARRTCTLRQRKQKTTNKHRKPQKSISSYARNDRQATPTSPLDCINKQLNYDEDDVDGHDADAEWLCDTDNDDVLCDLDPVL